MTLKTLFEKTVFILGAGASMDAGCRSSKEMLSDLKQSISDTKISWSNKDKFSNIYNFIIQSLLYKYALKDPDAKISEVTNIEDFVLVLQQIIDREYIVPPPLVGNWNNKITLWESQNKSVFTDFMEFIYECLVKKWTRFNFKKAQELLEPFNTLIHSYESFDLQIFSLNYDIMWESVFINDNKNDINTGFSQKKWIGDFSNPENPEKLKLYKLHGSVDWKFDKKEEQVKQVNIDEVNGQKPPLIIFGSGSKMQSYDPFLSLLGKFSETLKSTNLFIVVGYSFQDRYINNILIQSLSADLNKKMLVVDPNVKKEKDVFLKKIEQFQESKSMHDTVSLTQVSPDKIEISRSKSKKFFKEYLREDCKKLKELLRSVEEGESIF